MWTWLGLMNPHRLLWGYAWSFPYAQVVAVATLIGFVFAVRKARVPLTAPIVVLLAFSAWMAVTTAFALYPSEALEPAEKILKIILMAFVTLALTTERRRVEVLVLVATLSLVFYGFKGGIWTIVTGGANQVLGPANSFIEGNTTIGTALVMSLPLIRWMQLRAQRPVFRWGLGGLMVVQAFAILGTQSRGALLGLVAIGLMLVLKSRGRWLLLAGILVVAPLGYAFMPDRWHEKMRTIETYEQDTSAMGRITSWRVALRIAQARPFVGAGFASFRPESYETFAPDIPPIHGRYQDAHSIYFQVLGHHGYVGLFLFVLLLVSTWRANSKIIRRAKEISELTWAADLAAMIQVSLVGYLVSAAFLDLAYFDLLYLLIMIVVATNDIVERTLKVPVGGQATGSPMVASPQPRASSIGDAG